MARRYKVTTQYTPYTYEQLAAPVARATAIANQQYAYFSDIEAKNQLLERYLDPTIDGAQYQQFKTNQNQLKQITNDFIRSGLNSTTYNNIRNAKEIYTKDIVPMYQAVSTRISEEQSVSDFLSKHPDVVLKGPRRRSISEYFTGMPKREYISGESIKKDVSEISKLLSAARDPQMTAAKWSAYREQVFTRTGYTLPELEVARRTGSIGNINIINDVLQKHGVIDYKNIPLVNSNDYNKMRSYAEEGLYYLLGQTDVKLVNNDLDKQQDWWYKQQSLALAKDRQNTKDKEDEDYSLRKRIEFFDTDNENNSAAAMQIPTAYLNGSKWNQSISKYIASKVPNDKKIKVIEYDGKKYTPNDKTPGAVLNDLQDAQEVNVTFDIDPKTKTNRQNIEPKLIIRYRKKDKEQFKTINLESHILAPDFLDSYSRFQESPLVREYIAHPLSTDAVSQMQVYNYMNKILDEFVNELQSGIKEETTN